MHITASSQQHRGENASKNSGSQCVPSFTIRVFVTILTGLDMHWPIQYHAPWLHFLFNTIDTQVNKNKQLLTSLQTKGDSMIFTTKKLPKTSVLPSVTRSKKLQNCFQLVYVKSLLIYYVLIIVKGQSGKNSSRQTRTTA